jgi:hypothetical protein
MRGSLPPTLRANGVHSNFFMLKQRLMNYPRRAMLEPIFPRCGTVRADLPSLVNGVPPIFLASCLFLSFQRDLSSSLSYKNVFYSLDPQRKVAS